MKRSATMLIFLLLTACGSSTRNVPKVNHFQEGDIQTALLEAADATRDPYVIIETVPDRKFVQFWVENGVIEYDCPKGDLAEAEFEDVVDFHNTIGIQKTVAINTDPDTMEPFEMVTLSKQFQVSQSAEAANLAIAVLINCFGATEATELNIIRGWQP